MKEWFIVALISFGVAGGWGLNEFIKDVRYTLNQAPADQIQAAEQRGYQAGLQIIVDCAKHDDERLDFAVFLVHTKENFGFTQNATECVTESYTTLFGEDLWSKAE
jgi:hypothetical protein